MKPLEINDSNSLFLHIPSLSDGIITSSTPQKPNALGLKECENLYLNNGILKTRPALYTKPENALYNKSFANCDYIDHKATDIELELDGGTKRMILEKRFDYTSAYICLMHFVGSDGEYYKTVSLTFNRTDEDTFYIPDKISFFKGKPKTGKGVFCIVGTYNITNPTQKNGKIYELSSDLSHWEYIYNTYIPTALINGRGNRYEMAKQTGQAFTGAPTRLEGLNILNGEFHAYYSTDGYSSSFRLPFARLSSKRVMCRLYYSVESYAEWIIDENQDSATRQLYNVEVTMHVNREKGIIYFTVPSGEYELPLISDRSENNLRITAVKECDYSLNDLAAASSAINVGSKALIAADSHVFVSDIRNPLYFSAESITTVGLEDEPITALSTIGKSVFAFKDGAIYSLSVKNGKKINTTSLLADSDTVFFTDDIITASPISYTVGCKAQGCIALSCDRIFWYGSGDKIYMLSATGDIDCISEKTDVTRLLGEQKNKIVTAGFEKGCIFVLDSLIIALNEKNNHKNEYSIFSWKLPHQIKTMDAYSYDGKAFLVCKSTTADFGFISGLEGREDIWLCGDVDNPYTDTSPINTAFSTCDLNLGDNNTLKNINFISLRLRGKGATVCLNDKIKFKALNLSDADFKTVKIAPYLCGVDRLNISVHSDWGLEIGSIDIKYTSLKF